MRINKPKTVNELVNIATFSQDDKEQDKAMKILRSKNPTYHWCWEFDGLVICDEDGEFEFCDCLDENGSK